MSFQTAHFAVVSKEARWDPEFFGERPLELQRALAAAGAVPLKTFVSEAHRGTAPAYDPNGSVRVINSVNVRDLEVSEDRQSKVTPADLEQNPDAAVRSGDLMVTSTGIGTLGRVFCNLTGETYFADGHITIVRLSNSGLAPYLCAFLQSPLGRSQFIQRRRGSSRQVEIYPADILSVLVPPLTHMAERIAQEWRAAVSEVANATALYPKAEAQVLAKLNWNDVVRMSQPNCFQSRLSSVAAANRFDPEFFAPQHIRVEQALRGAHAVPFTALHVKYVKGTQPYAYSLDGDVIVIKSKDVLRNGVDLTTCDRAAIVDLEPDAGKVAPGMLLMNMTGVGTLGRAAVVPSIERRAVVSVDVSAWEIDSSKVPAEYIALFLNSPVGMAQTLRFQTGSSRQLHLYPEQVRNLWIFVGRTPCGQLDDDWHKQLASDARAASKARVKATQTLRRLHSEMSTAVGVSPRILRE